MALRQHTQAQPLLNTSGHAVRAGLTSQQPASNADEESEIGKYTSFPSPPRFENKLEERHYLKGRLAAAFRIFGARGFGKGVAGHIR
jgi:hypothetical protein